jgi:hypothetical protein
VTAEICKNKIVFVPGKNPKPPPEVHRALLWRCLRRGLELVDPAIARDITAMPDCFHLVAWNAVYYNQRKEVDEDAPWIEALCRKTGPDAADIREALSWRNKRARLFYLIADHLPALIPLLPDPAVKSAVRETERYFQNQDGIGSRVRELLKAELRQMFAAGDRVLVISHSMGAVIAYDALWELTHLEGHPGKIDMFLTLGSPLGMHYVQDRLLGFHGNDGKRFPCNIRRWVNVAAHGDLTALNPIIRDDFMPMIEQACTESIDDQHRGVFNYFRNDKGLNMHRSYGYLVEQHVARAILAWWQGGVEPACCVPERPSALAGRAGIA